ncbi:MAG: cation transporter, partial [Rhodobacteraceae bacterium]|nr:cation transporter [Paracoccaceae bacterium]
MALIIENADCPACIADIETPLLAIPGIRSARLNLTLKRLTVSWDGDGTLAPVVATELSRLGYRAVPFDAAALQRIDDAQDQRLLKAMAVAGFAGANIMLLSVSVW